MDTRLPAEVSAFAGALAGRFAGLGGVDLARRAEADPAVRAEAGAAIAQAGGSDLEVRADLDQLLAGAVLCRAAGAVVLPWPVVPHLLRVDGRFLAIIDPLAVRVDHGGLDVPWLGTDVQGQAWWLRPGARATGRLGPFVVAAELGVAAAVVDPDDVARHLALGAWTILGAAESALSQVTQHLRSRRQFGHPLSDFQSIRFAVADAAVALRGLEELAKFTTWHLTTAPPAERRAAALALRLHAVGVATAVLRACHQFYGAVGFCDETDLSVIDRHLQPVIRYPRSPDRLAEDLVAAARSGALSGRVP
jgi:hypothetical protein